MRFPAPSLQSCHHLPPALLLTGIVGLVTLVHRGVGPGPRRDVGGTTLHPVMLQGVSEAPLTWSNPGKSSAVGAWLQGYAETGAQEGTQAGPGALRGCSTAFVAL